LDPEIVKNTEFGFKMDMMDRRVRLNGALYSMDYDDMQLGVTRSFGEFNSSFGITNAGNAEVNGLELELEFMPLADLYISLTGSYIDADYEEFIDEFTNDQGETELVDGGATLDSYTLWNARLAFQSHQLEGLEVALYANNFTDEFFYGTGNLNAGLVGAASVVAGKSRTYGVEFYYNW